MISISQDLELKANENKKINFNIMLQMVLNVNNIPSNKNTWKLFSSFAEITYLEHYV